MKRFGLYKTLFKPYVKLLHFLHKNTYGVFNRNIGFLSAQKYFIVLFFMQTIIVIIILYYDIFRTVYVIFRLF